MRHIICARRPVQETARCELPLLIPTKRNRSVRRHGIVGLALLLLSTAAWSIGCSNADRPADEAHASAADFERGPHGGRKLTDGDFALELAIFEKGVLPEFRAYASLNGEPIDPSAVDLQVELRRVAGRLDRIHFEPSGDHLRGDRVVDEPHSFDVDVVAREGGREHRFEYSSYENRVVLDAEQIKAAGIRIESTTSAVLHERIELHGHVIPREDGWARVTSRFPGVVRSAPAKIGQSVGRGDVLATIESNQSLQAIEVRSPLSGVVVDRDVVAGEVVSPDRALFEVADLSSVVVELDVYRKDFARVAPGQPVWVDPGDGSAPLESIVDTFAPLSSPWTQTRAARAIVANEARRLQPGLFTKTEIEVATVNAPVAVRADAVQRLRNWDVVFLTDGSIFEAQPVELGRSDGKYFEIRSGLVAGQRYAATNSFLLKADAEKSGATHDH